MSKAEIEAALDPKRSKFNVDLSAKGKEARTYIAQDGQVIVFHSKHEKDIYTDYVLPQEHIGLFVHVKRQVAFDLHTWTPGGFKVKVGRYKADFVATTRDGTPLIIDAKGVVTDLYKLKKAIFEAEYGLRITEL